MENLSLELLHPGSHTGFLGFGAGFVGLLQGTGNSSLDFHLHHLLSGSGLGNLLSFGGLLHLGDLPLGSLLFFGDLLPLGDLLSLSSFLLLGGFLPLSGLLLLLLAGLTQPVGPGSLPPGSSSGLDGSGLQHLLQVEIDVAAGLDGIQLVLGSHKLHYGLPGHVQLSLHLVVLDGLQDHL